MMFSDSRGKQTSLNNFHWREKRHHVEYNLRGVYFMFEFGCEWMWYVCSSEYYGIGYSSYIRCFRIIDKLWFFKINTRRVAFLIVYNVMILCISLITKDACSLVIRDLLLLDSYREYYYVAQQVRALANDVMLLQQCTVFVTITAPHKTTDCGFPIIYQNCDFVQMPLALSVL